jgi:hypothetical protein
VLDSPPPKRLGQRERRILRNFAIFECTRSIAALVGEAVGEPTLSDDRSLDSWAEEQKRRRVSLDSQIERRER